MKTGIQYRKCETGSGVAVFTSRINNPRSIEEITRLSNRRPVWSDKTLQKARKWFYWSNAREGVEKWWQSCVLCTTRNRPKRRNHGKLHWYNVGTPLERIALVVLGSLLCLSSGNKCIFFCVCVSWISPLSGLKHFLFAIKRLL